MNELPKRKAYRLPDFDYSSSGAYFITVCTKDRKHTLSYITVGTSTARPYELHLSKTGEAVKNAILEIPNHYCGVYVDNYVIMPNHIHLIIRIEKEGGRPMVVPTVSRIIQQMKGVVTKRVGESVWQEKSYDHIIRDDYDYMIHMQYIDENPAKWLLGKDEYCDC